MEERKSPFAGHSIEQVAWAESKYFMIQVGMDFVDHKGTWTFTRKAAVTMYNKILDALMQSVYHGTEADKKTALGALASLRIIPLRFH